MMSDSRRPRWGLEILKITVPVLLGLAVWLGQFLMQRAWTDYENRLVFYTDVVRKVDAIFSKGTPEEQTEYLRATRLVWIGGSDEVVKAANRLSAATSSGISEKERRDAYASFILAIRNDLLTWRWRPPNSSTLGVEDFPIQAPGS